MASTREGVEALDPDRSGELQQRGDMVMQSFRSLFAKCDALTDRPQCAGPKSIQDPAYVDHLKLTTFRLESTLLPLLGEQLRTLSRLLDPSHLRKEPISELKPISQVQAQLDHTLDQIRSALESLPEQDAVPNQTTDQQQKELKYYRLNGLDQCVRETLLKEIAAFFFRSLLHVQQIVSSASSEQTTTSQTLGSTAQVDTKFRSEGSLGSAITWLRGSDWDTVLVGWGVRMEIIDRIMDSILNQTNSNRRGRFSARNIQLTRSLLPILKLTRVFLRKISKLGMKNKPLPHFTDMCTHQLQSLHDLPSCLIARIGSLRCMAIGTEVFDEASTTRFNDVARKLLGLLQSALRDVILSVIPLIPDTDGSQIHIDLRAWFTTWNNQLLVVIQNITRCATSFMENPQ